MIVEPKDSAELEPSLIEDVLPPHAEVYTDPEREEVRRRSIGHLQRQYLRSLAPKRSLWRKSARSKLAEPMITSPRERYQVVPPLRTFPSLYPEHPLPGISTLSDSAASNMRSGWDWIVNQFGRVKYWLALAWLSIAGWFHSAALKILPKRYTAASGMVIDWQARSLSRMRAALPLLVVLLLLTAAAWLSPSHSPRTLGGETSNAKLIPTTIRGSNAVQNSGSGSSSTNNSSSDPAALPKNKNAGTAFQQPMTSSTGVLSGSSGGIQTSSPASDSLSGTSTPTATVAIPPTQVQVGDKPVLDVSGVNFTVN
jgi:hypothetical protein